MSVVRISRSPDLKRLRDEGYAVEVTGGFLFVHDIPYLNAQRELLWGSLVAPLTPSGGRAARPNTHVIYFVGEQPYNEEGKLITAIQHSAPGIKLPGGRMASRAFSNKPKDGYANEYEKFTSYIRAISHPAMEVDTEATPLTCRLIPEKAEASIFQYTDMNSSRNGTLSLANKFEGQRIGIIGAGGTGAYIFDLIAKVPVAAIHLYDDDTFNAHNAFRSPGAATLEEVNAGMAKVEYLAGKYQAMHKGIVPHVQRINASNLDLLEELDFVFIAIDSGEHKQVIFEYLKERLVSFIDVGLGVLWSADHGLLQGAIRTTFGGPESYGHLDQVISYAADDEEDLYASNIQVAELNSLNAIIAVLKWKQHLGFYQSDDGANHTVFTINDLTTINAF